MSSVSSTSPTKDNAIIPTLFLIGVTALLVFFAVPRPYRDAALETPVATQEATSVAAANTSVEPTPEDHLVLMSLGLEEVPQSSVQNGQRIFNTICSACHGSNAKGIPGLGKTLVDSNFVNQNNDDQLVAFIIVGRSTSDPANTTGVAMPAKGGNSSLTDAELNAVVDYIRSLNGATVIDDIVGEPTPVPTVRPFKPLSLGSSSSDATSTPETGAAPVSTAEAPVTDATPTPVVSYGFDTQTQATAEAPVTDATPTPVVSYGFDTQAQATAEAPVTDATATPVVSYGFETQSQATAEATKQP